MRLGWLTEATDEEFEKGRKLKAQVSEKRAERGWKTPVRVMRKKPRQKDKLNYETDGGTL